MASSATTCSGCLYGELNQLGHMDPGGCLYFEEDLLDGGPSLAAGAAAPPAEEPEPAAEEEPASEVVYLTAAELEDEVVWPCRGIGVPPEMWAELCPEGTSYRTFTRQELEDVLALPYQMGNTTPVTDSLWTALLERFG
jgi:hypothetical protein